MNESLVIVEPMCRGFEHVQFNAPFLQSCSLAFPGAPLSFLAESSHLDFVRAVLEREAPGLHVQWRKITLPDRHLSPRRRMQRERGIIQEAFRLAGETHGTLVAFASATDTLVLATKLLLFGSKPRLHTLMVLHGVLAGLEDYARPVNAWRGISLALKMPNPRTLRLIVPGQPIQETLAQRFPRIARHTRPAEHPAFWAEKSIPEISPRTPVRFGFFGVSAVPGFDMVTRVAETLGAEGSAAEFSMVGHLNHPDDATRDYAAVPDACPRLLSESEYADRARRLTYSLWTTRAHRSGLVASTTFLDALSFVKPLVYLANPLIDAYAALLGDIGYRCADERELTDVVRSLAAEWPQERYRAQCAAILAGRHLFEPSAVAASVRRIVHELRENR